MTSVLIPLAPGCEELEAVTLINLFRRADFDVVTAGLHPGPVTCSRKTVLVPDMSLDEALDREYDLIVLPGGLPGSDHLDATPIIREHLRRMHDAGKHVAAICAAPKVLASAGLLSGKRATAYPGTLESLELPDTHITGAVVEIDGKVVTSRGPGTAMDFGLALIELLAGPERRKAVEDPLCRP